MRDDYHSLMVDLSENMLTVIMLLSVFSCRGVDAERCDNHTPGFLITTPRSLVALSGSCLHVPCSFTFQTGENDFNNGEQPSAAWIPSNMKIFDISKGVNNHEINITGDIKEKSCTTVFSDIKTTQETKYFLRIERGKYRATACSTPLQIEVQDSPLTPSINVSSDLKEHQSVTVTCSAFTPCPHSPPELTWNLQQDSLRQTERNTDGTFTTKIQENITLSDTHDGYNITCSARYPVKGGNKKAETQVTLSVSSGNVSFWTALPVSISVILLVCLVICVWWFKFKHPSAQQTQTQTEMEVQTPDKKPDEEIHYGEVNFLQRKPAASTVSVEDRGQQETVYAPVRVSAGH